MVNPVTVNLGLIVPLTGADVDLWGQDDINPNMAAVDGLIGGVQTISVNSAPVTLTSPAAFVPTPSAGPTQSQNRVLRFTGALAANVVVTLPIPGAYIIENLTTGNFVLSFRGIIATEVIGFPPGERLEIYNDGANVRFVGMGRVGVMEMWAGLSAMPAWVAACTVKPYLLSDGTVYNIADYVALGSRLLSKFGGNGITTFGIPDMAGRVPLAYDSTGARITTAGCGIDGQTLGAAGGVQSITLDATQIPSHQHSVFLKDPGHDHSVPLSSGRSATSGTNTTTTGGSTSTSSSMTGMTIGSVNGVANDNQTAVTGGGLAQANAQPSIVVGIWVVKT